VISFSPDPDPDRMLTYTAAAPNHGGDTGSVGSSSYLQEINTVLYGKGLEQRFLLAREPLRVCYACYEQLRPLQEELRKTNSNAMRYNHVDPTDPRRLFNSPIAFTLGHEVRKAAYTLNNLLPLPKRGRMGALTTVSESGSFQTASATQQCQENCSTLSPNLGNVDGVRIPARLLEEAKGVAVMTVCKGGFGLVGGEFGTGLVVARLPNGSWSAPSAIGTAGVSWGALIGAQVSDHVFLLMTDAAVEMLFHNNGSLQLGADVALAVGPLGRVLEGDIGASPGQVAGIYTYSLSKGLYAGASLDSKVIVTRHDVNERFYGREVSGAELLSGAIPTPPAAQPLYDALTRCHVYVSGGARRADSFRMHRGSQHDLPMPIPPPQQVQYGGMPPMMPPDTPPDEHSYTGTVSELTTD
jgi:lipid-binding SYLF domain-containing protein